jgi:hypothetical protein
MKADKQKALIDTINDLIGDSIMMGRAMQRHDDAMADMNDASEQMKKATAHIYRLTGPDKKELN